MHTPGPWKVSSRKSGSGRIYYIDADKHPEVDHCDGIGDIATIYGVRQSEEEERANAHLLAAAPDLLAALERLDATHFFADTVEHEDWGLYVDEAIPEIRAVYIQAIEAIAKAKGDIA